MDDPDKNDEQKFNETLKRMLNTPPKPHKKGAEPKPDAPQALENDLEDFSSGSQDGRDAKKAGC